ncbi:hypothetical protein [Massilia glaciei]|uniref:Uncharacterized protein n=1 Tax=Massilia glaciei TaxID=1524097 RepID=A0A2U2HK41_9BURK|nr:hypothetical protein [Massilia glaciei]PWF47870.1 hypothetical protein C7C56_013475 [Massilia glaciei]
MNTDTLPDARLDASSDAGRDAPPDALCDAIAPAAPTTAARRAALIAQIAAQRQQVSELVAPVAGGALSAMFGGRAKIALAVGGVVLGLIATRPGGAMTLITGAMSAYKMVRGMLQRRALG